MNARQRLFFCPAGLSFAAVAAAGLLAACGGGGGGSSPSGPLTITTTPVLAGSALVYAITLPNGYNDASIVTYRTADVASGLGYATGGLACGAGVDYIAVPAGSVTITRSGTVNITTCPNASFEPNEQLVLVVDWQGGSTRNPGLIVNTVAGGLNDTGSSQCLDASGALVACTAATALAGQDGSTGRDTTAVSNGGSDGRLGFAFTASGGCVTDHVTGLVWDSSAESAGTVATAEANVAAANTAARCGASDWRLPTTAELLSLVDAGLSSGARIDPTFADTPANGFWTAEPYAGDTRASWLVDFSSGAVAFDTATNPLAKAFSSRLVRGTADTPACDADVATLVTNSNATVTDSRLGLMWQQCAEGLSGAGCATGTATVYGTYAAALSRAAAVNADPAGAGRGHSDWRVPNRNELASLVNRRCEAPAIQRTPFPGTPSASFWTATPAFAGFAWYVDFTDGSIGPGGTTGDRVLRLVRGGQ
ncbi:MAG: DUF1566 domain-containing protein [Rubrivivax sp.]|nr:DUF1566 domain-containing protein [Rubrivivax sp.]